MSARKFQLCGVGNALVDLLVEIDEPLFRSFDLEKGTMRLVEAATQKDLLRKIPNAQISRASGGSVANSMVSFANLGGKAAFFGAIAADDFGTFYHQEFQSFDIAFPIPAKKDCVTGTSLVLITPDSERTMRTHLGDGLALKPEMIDEETISQSEKIFIEGYILANPENRLGGIDRVLALAKQYDTKIVLTLSEAWVVETCREEIEKVLKNAALVFSNETEACALAGTNNIDQAIIALNERGIDYAVTRGEKGAVVSVGHEQGEVKSTPVTTVDLTGAGDMFAGAFLYGLSAGVPAVEAGSRASYLAAQVITHIGARFKGDLKREYTKFA